MKENFIYKGSSRILETGKKYSLEFLHGSFSEPKGFVDLNPSHAVLFKYESIDELLKEWEPIW